MSLLKIIKENPLEEHGKQLTAAFFINLCVGKTFQTFECLSNSDVLLLVKMITLNPKPEKRSCPEYNFLKSCLLDERYVKLLTLTLRYIVFPHPHLTQGLVQKL